jgi:bifunctional non-homologous end joining protein LigD
MTLPRIHPIIPVAVKQPFDDPEWFFELKYDGFRALCYIEHGRSRFISRNGNHLSRFDDLCRQLADELDVNDAILDGEVIAADETGRPRFYDLLRRTREPSYVSFDVLWLNGLDLRCLPFSDRRQRLLGILPKGSRFISEAPAIPGRGRELFDLMRAHDLEGIVAKRLGDLYQARTKWLKIKNPEYSQQEGRGDLFNGPRVILW